MFFGKYEKKQNKFIDKKTSLQACHKQIDPNSSDSELNPKTNNKKRFQRTFFLAPSEYGASICVEASLSFSFFLFFLTNVFSMIFIFQSYASDFTTLQQRGKELASIAYLTEGLTGKNEDLIRLQKTRTIESMYPILSVPNARIRANCVVKPWTGYDVINGKMREEEDILVYVTQYGSVYHKDRSCTHLSLSIETVDFIEVEFIKNENNVNYSPCEYCGENNFVTVYYITKYGDRFHTSIKCRGLRRYIKSIPLSKVNGMPPCSKCG